MTPPTAPILSVIIINWNGARYLPRCLQSLREQTLRDFQVILADNGSTDASVALAAEDYPEVDIVEYGENLGYAEGNNRAAALSQARYLLFLNNDTRLDTEALATLVAAAENRSDAAILAPQQRTYDGERVLSVGLGLDILGYPCDGRVFYSDGAALFIRRAVFNALGGFDRRYFMFGEDSDLCWRAWLQRHTVAAVPAAIIYHKAGGTAGSSIIESERYSTNKTRRRLAHRNQLTSVLKNYAAPTLCMVLPLFALHTLAEVLLLIVTGQRSAVRDAYVPAWQDVIRNRSYIWAMRKRVQASRRVSDRVILRRMEWKLSTVRLFFRIGVPTVK